MKRENAQDVIDVEIVSGGQLLKLVHVANFSVKNFSELVAKSPEKRL